MSADPKTIVTTSINLFKYHRENVIRKSGNAAIAQPIVDTMIAGLQHTLDALIEGYAIENALWEANARMRIQPVDVHRWSICELFYVVGMAMTVDGDRRGCPP